MEMNFLLAGEPVKVQLERQQDDCWQLQVGERTFRVDYSRLSPETASLLIDGRSLTAHVSQVEDNLHVSIGGRRYTLQLPRQDRAGRGAAAAGGTGPGSGSIKTPMPGLIVKVLVQPGATVEAGNTLVILEAMKMENAVKAPFAAVVKAVNVAEGDQTNLGDVLIEIEALQATAE
ncbi:MAG: biotin/lipoyl-binding protein [Candidatus Delongbacteria bacterium]|nr:biotin/lipoyl-binding protein [bacterium]MBL7033303.1 biotin/lipoyl-binding protein [Candidatus Delongbacteria bacterium]